MLSSSLQVDHKIQFFKLLNQLPVCSVGFYQMAKISVTPTIALAEFLLFSKKTTLYKVGGGFSFTLFSTMICLTLNSRVPN